MNARPCIVFAEYREVIADHGGEVVFWPAWVRGGLSPELQTWFRQAAAHEPELARDLQRVEQPDGAGFTTAPARELLAAALEAHDYAPDPADEDGTQPLTEMALLDDASELTRAAEEAHEGPPEARPAAASRARQLVRPRLFALLEELGIEVEGNQVEEARLLLDELVGPAAVARFRSLCRVARDVWERAHDRPAGFDRALRELLPNLFARGDEPPRLSYRLYLRARLRRYCRGNPRFRLAEGRSFRAAFAGLTRERIGEIMRDTRGQVGDAPALKEGLALAEVDQVAA